MLSSTCINYFESVKGVGSICDKLFWKCKRCWVIKCV